MTRSRTGSELLNHVDSDRQLEETAIEMTKASIKACRQQERQLLKKLGIERLPKELVDCVCDRRISEMMLTLMEESPSFARSVGAKYTEHVRNTH